MLLADKLWFTIAIRPRDVKTLGRSGRGDAASLALQLLQPLALLRGRLYNSGDARVAHW